MPPCRVDRLLISLHSPLPHLCSQPAAAFVGYICSRMARIAKIIINGALTSQEHEALKCNGNIQGWLTLPYGGLQRSNSFPLQNKKISPGFQCRVTFENEAEMPEMNACGKHNSGLEEKILRRSFPISIPAIDNTVLLSGLMHQSSLSTYDDYQEIAQIIQFHDKRIKKP
jgi:hypothetical protein